MLLSITLSLNIIAAAWSQVDPSNYQQQRDYFVYRKCGPESASFVGGPASRNRVEYVRCRTSARREFKRTWESP